MRVVYNSHVEAPKANKTAVAGAKTVVNVVLTNRTAAFPQVEHHTLLRPFFSFRPPGYYFSPKYRFGIWDGYIHMLRHGKVPSGLFLAQRARIEKEAKVRFSLVSRLQSPQFHKGYPSNIAQSIREYQNSCVEAMQAARCGGLVLNATGTGKTFTAGAFFSKLQGHGCFVVDELTLLEQARRELTKVLGETVGQIGDQVFSPRRITVATIQTLHRHRFSKQFLAWSKLQQVMVIDEIHLALNRRNLDVVSTTQPLQVFGLTATLEIEKPEVAMRAMALAGPVIFSYSLREGVAEGVLAKGVVYQVPVCANGKAAGYQSEYHRLISHSATRNQMVEDLVREGLKQKYRVVVLVERLAHLRLLQKRLTDIPHQVLCGAYSKEERIEAKDAMDRGELNLILATRVFSKGVDIRKVDVIIDATAGRSHNSVAQRYGRGVRTAKGKLGLIYLDLADATPIGGVKNRFESCSRSRRKALKELGIPVYQPKSQVSTQRIYQLAQRHLREQTEVGTTR